MYLVRWHDSRLVFECVCTHHSPPIIIRKHMRRFRLSPTPFSLHPTSLSKPAHYEIDHPPARPPSRIDDDAPSRDGVATSHACESCPTANTKSKPLNPPTPAPPTRCPCRPVPCARVVSWCVHGAPRAMRRRARRVDSCSGETRATREETRARDGTMGQFSFVRAASRSRVERDRARVETVARAAADRAGKPWRYRDRSSETDG